MLWVNVVLNLLGGNDIWVQHDEMMQTRELRKLGSGAK
jgi:hypothetical protein